MICQLHTWNKINYEYYLLVFVTKLFSKMFVATISEVCGQCRILHRNEHK